jgi:hypothetical protein
MDTRDLHKLQGIRDSVDLIGNLSDALIRFGPFSLGIDGVLSWIPGLGEAYSTAAAAFILVQGARARAPISTLAGAAALMGARTLISAIPLAGPAAADVFIAHKWAARLVVKAIDRRLGQDSPDAADRSLTPAPV